MSTNLKQDILNAVRKGNCPDYKQNSHACFGCPWGELGETTYNCKNSKYDNDQKTYIVKPRKVTQGFCEHCGKRVKFRLDWEGCVWPTNKGIVAYQELYAYCPHCYHPIYVPAVNDVNVYRREKAYAEKEIEPVQIPIVAGELARRIEEQLKMKPSEKTERGKKILKEMFEGREQNG